MKIFISLLLLLSFGTTYSQDTQTAKRLARGTTQNNDAAIFAELRDRWTENLIGNAEVLLQNQNSEHARTVSSNAQVLLDTINYETWTPYDWDNGTYFLDNSPTANQFIWNDTDKMRTFPSHLTTTITRLEIISRSYRTPGTAHYQNPETLAFLISALDWFVGIYYGAVGISYGNWWDWQIGTPNRLVDVVILLYDSLTPEQRTRYTASIDNHLPNVTPGSSYHRGANLADVILIKARQGIIDNDSTIMGHLSKQLVLLFKYTTESDGFYTDGSFIQHKNVAYTGSYGAVLISRTINVMYLLGNTPWEVKNPMLFDWLINAISPIIYRGQVVYSVRGRSVARNQETGAGQGRGYINSFLRASLFADDETRVKLESIVKSWMLANPSIYSEGNLANIINVTANKILKDPSIVAMTASTNFAMNNMERSVHHRPDYTFSLARTSTRVAKNESINNENVTPWYQSDGTAALYNDLTQFEGSYWATLNPYHMSGVTKVDRPRNRTEVDKITRKSLYPRDDFSLNTLSGGVSLGAYGSAAMTIKNQGESLTGNKSWFMFDDEILFMASDIGENSSHGIETTVENRRLVNQNNTVLVNGQNLNQQTGPVQNVYIQGDAPRTSTAYVFLDTPRNIKVSVNTESGSWTNIAPQLTLPPTADLNTYTNNFARIVMNHGTNVQNQQFAYVLLPNATAAEVTQYRSPIIILTNSKNIHAINHTALKIKGIHFFGKGSFEEITAPQELLYLEKEEEGGVIKVSISDPNISSRKISVQITGVASVSHGKDIKSRLSKDTLIISIPSSVERGGVYEFSYTKLQ